MANTQIRVLIVDKYPLARAGLAAILGRESDMAVAGEAASGEAAIELFFRIAPDVVVIDPALPGMDGSGTIQRIRASEPGARFLAVSNHIGDEDVHRALKAGAKGYVTKEAEPDEILTAIRAVRAGFRHISPCIVRTLEQRVRHEALTQREIEVLEAIARGSSNREIALAMNLSESTVKARVKEILSKLGVNDRTAAVTAALRRGIIHL